MIDQVDDRLKDWIGVVLGPVPISLDAPGVAGVSATVHLYLMEFVHAPPPRGVRRPPLQISLRYLLTTQTDRPEEAHRLLGELVFAAMEHPEYEVEPVPVSVEVWKAFGIPPRPSFTLCVPLRQERPQPAAIRVTQPLVIDQSPMRILFGQVYGPNDIPIMGACIELPALNRTTQSDYRGQFRFQSVPVAHPFTLIVRAKGQEIEIPLTAAELPNPLVIHLNGLEG